MTWYWWTHWFWITAVNVIELFFLIFQVHTFPLNPSYSIEEMKLENSTSIQIQSSNKSCNIFNNRSLQEIEMHTNETKVSVIYPINATHENAVLNTVISDNGHKKVSTSINDLHETKNFNESQLNEVHILTTDTRFEVITENDVGVMSEQKSGKERKPKNLIDHEEQISVNFSSESQNLLAPSSIVTLNDKSKKNSNEFSRKNTYILNVGAISGICFAVFGLCFGFSLIGITFYRKRYLNKPQTLSEFESSGYIDDSTIRDNSDEMYSLDNDSFLNSLEAMTIQNYWTDTVKHTKL